MVADVLLVALPSILFDTHILFQMNKTCGVVYAQKLLVTILR
jgi:hypothetical protein